LKAFLCGVAAVLLLAPGLRAQASAVPPLLRIVDSNLQVGLPIHFCSVPTTVVGLAKRFNLVAGIEFTPGECSAKWAKQRPAGEEVNLLGLTVEEALDKLVEIDRRYRWVESDGVIVIRPVDAWGDPKNFLNQISPAFVIDDKNLGGALDAIASNLDDQPHRGSDALATRTAQGSRTFSVHLRATSVVGVLNAIVKEHGAMWWEVHDHARVATGQESRMVWLYTHDGSGLGVTTKRYPPSQ